MQKVKNCSKIFPLLIKHFPDLAIHLLIMWEQCISIEKLRANEFVVYSI